MDPILSDEQLEELRRFPTPTISNAIEAFDVRPRNEGFLPHYIRALMPDLPAIIGYAVTATTAAAPPTGEVPQLLNDYFRYVAGRPGRKIAVGQDLDDPAGLGAQFGEVTATIHKKLGCVGHVTSGCPRDLDEVRALGFPMFGLNPCVSHAYVRIEDFGNPVTLGGVVIHSGDLLHADKHGVCIIPRQIAPRLAEACRKVEEMERPALVICGRDDFDLEEYLKLRAKMSYKIGE